MEMSFQKTGGPILTTWLRILICTQLFSVSFVKSQCVRCEDFNRIQPQGCVQDYKQCGDCLPNYVKNPEDPLRCDALSYKDVANILEQPDEKITQVINSEVYLDCKFNAMINCKWSKDGEEVKDIGTESNRQWSTGDGKYTHDCSLIINRLGNDDEGKWVCSNIANSHFEVVSSRSLLVYIALPVPLIHYGNDVWNRDSWFDPGEKVMAKLDCKLPSSGLAKKITLSWVFNGDRLYKGQANERILTLGPELIAVMEEKLRHRYVRSDELQCMAEDEFGQVSTAKVFFDYYPSKPFKKSEPYTPFHRDIPSHHDFPFHHGITSHQYFPDRPKIPVNPYANLIGAILLLVFFSPCLCVFYGCLIHPWMS